MARLGVLFDLLENAERADNLRRQQVRQNNRLNPENDAFFLLSDEDFFKTYRLTKSLASTVIHELEPHLPSVRSTSISAVAKVLTAISFYAHGSYQLGVGQCLQHNMCQQSVSNCIAEVTAALNSPHMRQKYIKFPQCRAERDTVIQRFFDKFNVPGVLGCVDGTHVAIIRPVLHEERYINRKGYHSLNAQIVCDSDLNILNVDAAHGGSNHDSFIWEQHPLRSHLEELQLTQCAWFLDQDSYEEYKNKEKSRNTSRHESPNEPSSSHKYNDLKANKKEKEDTHRDSGRSERREKSSSNGRNRDKDRKNRDSSSEDRVRRNRKDSSSEERSSRRKKEKKRYSSNESLDSLTDEKQKKHKSRRKQKSSDESDDYKKNRRRSKTPEGNRDIDKKRKGKKKKRDRDRSPNYKKHRK